MTRTLEIDIETFSDVDLLKAGVYKYAESEDFEILLFAYSYDGEPVTVLDLASRDTKTPEIPEQILKDLADPDVTKIAYNANFERVCLSHYLYNKRMKSWESDRLEYWNSGLEPRFKFFDPKGWYCAMVHSSMCGLPASLDIAGKALGLPEDKQKLATGKALIKYFCMPCKPTKANGYRTRNRPEDAPEKWQQFIDYNQRDVETEAEIERRLNLIYSMPRQELERYWIDQQINDDGIAIDMDMVNDILKYGDVHAQKVLDQAQEIAGISIKSVKQLKKWLEDRAGIQIDQLTKESVTDLIKTTSLPDVKKVLELRLEAGKTSVKKYDVFKRSVTNDGRIHGCFQFYGSRTGRFAGRLVQPQNLPRNSFDDFDWARQLVKWQDWEELEATYPSMNDVFATLIRTAFIPRNGCAFAVADYSAIEARVIAWLADEKWRLEAFHNGKDIYCESASQMFHVPVEKHGINGRLRKQGKIAELALGYGGGVNALKAFGAEKMGMTEEEMAEVVVKWRAASPNVCRLWQIFDRMVAKALAGERPQGPKGMEMWIRAGCLMVKLPSGRCLVYQNPRMEAEKGHRTPTFTFDGVNQTTHKWEAIHAWGGKLTENVVQAIARDCLVLTMDRIHQYWNQARIVMHIHDEVVVEVPTQAQGEWLQRILDIMARPILWAPGLELKGAGFTADYYQKD